MGNEKSPTGGSFYGFDPLLGGASDPEVKPTEEKPLSGFDQEWPYAAQALGVDEYISARREYEYNRSPEKADLDRLREAMESKIDCLQSEQRDLLRQFEKLHERLDQLATAEAVERLEKKISGLDFDQRRIMDACHVIVGFCAKVVSVSLLALAVSIGMTLIVWAQDYWKTH